MMQIDSSSNHFFFELHSKMYAQFDNVYCNGTITRDEDRVVVDVHVNSKLRDSLVHYKAASPVERRSGFTGSGLPFPNYKIAFENSVNAGSVLLKPNQTEFRIELETPNSYLDHDGSTVLPYVEVTYNTLTEGVRTTRIAIPNVSIPYRTLTYPKRESPVFDIVTQEARMRRNAYPSGSIPVRG